MAFDPRYIPAFNIEEILLNKDNGQPLTGGKVYFEVYNQPGVPKPVWQVTYSSGIYTYVELPNPMILSSIGTFEDALENPVIPYFFPYDAAGAIQYYRVRVLSSGDVEQFVRDPVPSVPDSGSSAASTAYENELSNPQFSEVLFDTVAASYTYNFNTAVSEVVSIAPNWDIIVSSAGVATVTVTQVKPAGTLNVPTNPGTLLKISSAGLSSFQLRQRLFGSPNLWGSGNLAATFVASVSGGTSAILALNYVQSNSGTAIIPLITATLPGSGAYTSFTGSAAIPTSTSVGTFPDAYIDIYFVIPLSREVTITSVMVTATGTTSVPALVYDQVSRNRMIDYLFHYYKPQLVYKPIPSYLVGWDFPLNPSQFFSNGVTSLGAIGANKSSYVWDQTIVFQTVNNVVSTARNSANNGLNITVSSDSSFAVIQYIPTTVAREILSQRNAIQLKGSMSAGTLAGTVSLWWTDDATLPDIKTPNFNSLVSSITAGVPTCANGTWKQVNNTLRKSSNSLPFTFTSTPLTFDFIGFEDNQTGFTNAKFMAIVVCFNTMLSTQTMTMQYGSLVGGDIPTRPAPQTPDEVLRECEYYFEQSYVNPADVATATDDGGHESPMSALATGGGNAFTYASPFDIVFNVPKINDPTLVYYSTTGLIANVNSKIFYSITGTNAFTVVQADQPVATFWDVNISQKSIIFLPKVTTVLNSVANASLANSYISGGISYQYRADSRLGTY